MKEYDKYLKLLKEKYPTKQSVYRELINLNAIMNLPKGTEHFKMCIRDRWNIIAALQNLCKKSVFLVPDSQSVDAIKQFLSLIHI